MLRTMRLTAFLGTILVASAALAAEPSKPASDDKAAESGKAGTPPAAPAATPAATPAWAAVPPPPPPPPPEADEASESEAAPVKARKKRTIGSAGMDTQSTTIGGAVDLGDAAAEKDWRFKFKGFFRAPMRLGIDASGSLTPGEMQYHAPPVVPDGNYTRWSYTNLNPGPWAELLFQYGNQQVMMTTSIASYNITTGGWRELQDQLGIDRAFLTLKFPEALGDIGGMAFDVGIFQNAYGAAGKYDAGEYETYVIGRTRMAGVTATADLEVADDVKVIFEGGGGAKVDQQYQRYESGAATYDYPTWMPYPGNKTQQGTNILVHGHAGALLRGVLMAQAHYIGSFVKDKRWNVGTTGGTSGTFPADGTVPGYGYIQVAGIDLKLNGGWMGDGYLGYSYIKAKNALTINDSIEVLHSQGGWQFTQNYFPTEYAAGVGGNGEIHTIGGQYTFSLAGFMMRPRPFWGQAVDVTIRPYFMYNKVVGTPGGADDVTKFKGGLDLLYSFMPMMAAGLRLDSVNPNMDNSEQTFYVVSPRLVFRSEFVTHEAVVLQYSFYKYGAAYTDPAKSAAVMPWPYGQYGTWSIGSAGLNMQPDKHVLSLWAQMWW
jgi:hypothetical protein